MKRETPLTHSFCQYVAASQEPLVVSDARKIPLVSENLAVSDLNVIAYAGVPLTTESGDTLGSFCAIDTEPRAWTSKELEILHTLAGHIRAEIDLRLHVGKGKEEIISTRSEEERRQRRLRQNVHDLRIPVTSVLLGPDAIKISGTLNNDQQRYLEIAKTSAKALNEIVSQLLKRTPSQRKERRLWIGSEFFRMKSSSRLCSRSRLWRSEPAFPSIPRG